MGLLEAGLGWGWLPTSLVQERLDRGRLKGLTLKTPDNGMALCVDVAWSRERSLGLGGGIGGGDWRGRGRGDGPAAAVVLPAAAGYGSGAAGRDNEAIWVVSG